MELTEWGDFWPQFFKTRPFTRRVAKRLITQGDLPGRVIDDQPFVDALAFSLGLKSDTAAHREALEEDDLIDL